MANELTRTIMANLSRGGPAVCPTPQQADGQTRPLSPREEALLCQVIHGASRPCPVVGPQDRRTAGQQHTAISLDDLAQLIR